MNKPSLEQDPLLIEIRRLRPDDSAWPSSEAGQRVLRRALSLAPREMAARPRNPRFAHLLGAPSLRVGLAAVMILGLAMFGAIKVIAGQGPDLQYTATPRLLSFESSPDTAPAAAKLRALADTVRASGASPAIDLTVRTKSWNLSTRVDGELVHSAIVPEMRTLQRKADGSGHLSVRTAAPTFPSSQFRQAWQDAGSPAAESETVEEWSFSASEFHAMFPQQLSPQSDLLAKQLAVGHPYSQEGTGELLTAVSDLYEEQTPGVAVRAALLNVLVSRTDLQWLGPVTDRSGRTGDAVATETDMTGLPTRTILVFDAHDGRLLSREDILTKDAGHLDVPIPCVSSYILYR